MFGLGRKKAREERALIAKNKLKKLQEEEKTAKLEYSVKKKEMAIRELKAKPRKEALKRFGDSLKPALQQMKANKERNEKYGTIFNPIEQEPKKTKKKQKESSGFSGGPFNGGVF
jgi:transposase